MRGGVLALGAGMWLLSQIFSGNLLGRLGLVGAAATAREAEAAADTGTPARAPVVTTPGAATGYGGRVLTGGRTAG